MLFDPIWDRTVIGAEYHSVHTAHFNRGSQSNWVEPHGVDQDVGLEVVGWRPFVLVRPAGRRVADPIVVEVPIEFEASKDRREFTAHVDDQHLKLWVTIKHAGADHPGSVDCRIEGTADRLV